MFAARKTVYGMVQRATAKGSSLPSPVGGWNARDSLANMDERDAVIMENMFPNASNVVLRGGFSQHSTGMSGQVQTIMGYAGAATNEMFAIDATGKTIYDVTGTGAATPTTVTGLTNAIWEYTNVATAGGNFLYCVNGLDKPRLYNGTTWVAIDGASVPAITGVTTTTLNNVLLFKNRVWFIQKNTLKAWYLPTQSVGGAAQSFDLSAVATKGGYIVDFDAWTIDAGYGVDDNLAFITNKGEVIVYRGTDPASAATWSLIGVWQIGAPVGSRPMLKWGGDLLIMTYDGLVPMAQTLQSSRLDPRVALSDKIQSAISAATSSYGTTFGWQVLYYPKRNAVWINVPVAVGQQQQFAMNTITTAWCSFKGWDASCWAIFNDEPYFGADGIVCRAWTDDYADNGANITTTTLQAFNYFDERLVQKYFTRVRPSIFSNGSPAIQVGINVDFDVLAMPAAISYPPTPASLWDVGVWDVSVWGQSLQINASWQGVTGLGYCGAVSLQSTSSGIQIEWAATDVVYQAGWAGV